MSKISFEELSQIFSALANPTRLQILEKLIEGPATVSKIAEPFSMSLPGITNHLNKLEGVGLISRSKDAQKRPTKLRIKPIKEIDLWIRKYREIWNDRLDRLDRYVNDIQSGEDESYE